MIHCSGINNTTEVASGTFVRIRGREEGVEGYVVAGEINSEITALYAIRAGQDF